MRKFFTFLFICIAVYPLHATTYFQFKFNFNYTANVGQDSSLLLVFNYTNNSNIVKDSFQIKKGQSNFTKNYQFASNFTIDYLIMEVRGKNRQLLGSYTSTGGCYTVRCDGYNFDALAGGAGCADFSAKNGGKLCGGLQFNFVQDSIYNNIQVSNGHFSDKYGIYCAFSAKNQENPLQLAVPCYFLWQNKAKNIRWYESQNGIDQWQFLDTGYSIYPAQISYNGGRMYNVKRYYKCVVDTNYIVFKYPNFSSNISSAVRFYLGAGMDSVQVINSYNCSQQSNIILHFKTDTNTLRLKAPRVWVFYKATDTSTEQRWFLDTLQHSPVALRGRTLFQESGYPAPPPILPIATGRYRIMHDFTPWNGFDCKLEMDTVQVIGQNYGFTYGARIIQNNTCAGQSNGIVQGFYSSTDTASIQFSLDNIHWQDSAFQFKQLAAAKHIYYVRNSRGCTIIDSFYLNNPPVFSTKFKVDTTLCIGQNLHINAFNPNALKYRLDSSGKTIYTKDTFTINHAGVYVLHFSNAQGCTDQDTLKIKRFNLEVKHDFLIPSVAFITDSVVAVNSTQPNTENFQWSFSNSGVTYFPVKKYSVITKYPDTGYYVVTLKSRVQNCGFILDKKIHIIGNADSAKTNSNLGYKGPLIQSFTIDPNPNDGLNFTLKIRLRDTANISIYKIDPISGEIIGDIDLYKKKVYESTAFTDANAVSGVYYLKLVAKNESKTIKVVVVK